MKHISKEKEVETIYILREYTNNRNKQKRVTLNKCKIDGVKNILRYSCSGNIALMNKLNKITSADVVIINEYTYEIYIIDKDNFREISINSDDIYYSLVDYINENSMMSETITSFGHYDTIESMQKQVSKIKNKDTNDLIIVSNDGIVKISKEKLKESIKLGISRITKLIIYKNIAEIETVGYLEENIIIIKLKDASYYALYVSNKVYEELKEEQLKLSKEK